jgi:HAD superfamily hydrolase (TIGR01509 family)
VATEIYARKKEIFNDLIDAQKVPLRPGVNYIVDEAIAAGIKLAVCSSSDDRAVGHVVNLMGKERAKHIRIFAAGSLTKLKPDPEVYNLAIRQLGVPAEDCVAIEDSHDGLAAAKAAGIACIVAPSSYTQHQDFSRADLVVSGLNELDLDTIIRQARSTQFHLSGANC